jgi:hypothetical protein
MRFRPVTLAMMALVLLTPLSMAQSIDEPRFVNKLLDDFRTPVIVPGQSGDFSLNINNPDPVNLTGSMTNVMLNASIYQYATLEESRPVGEIPNPPIVVQSGGVEYGFHGITIGPGGEHTVTFTVSTEKSTPHGSYFSQSTYFVRFWLEFEYEGVNYTMVSRGYFNDQQWLHLTQTETGAGEVNQTYLQELGYDGIIPDSAFAVKIPIPMWPLYLLMLCTVFVGCLAVSFYILDNPGSFPRVELHLLRLTGRCHQLRRRLFKGRKKGPST